MTLQNVDQALSLPPAPMTAVQPADGRLALGMAVSYLMIDPVFARLTFGHWSRVLVGQINRRHYFLVLQDDRVVGFAGWALANKENAEAWLAGTRDLGFDESKSGEMVVLNVWKANSREAHRFLVDAFRNVIQNKTTIYIKRFYAGGRMRAVRLPVNSFVTQHIARQRHDPKEGN